MSEIKINIGNLDTEIAKLKKLATKISSEKNERPKVVGGGSSIQELENIGLTYEKMYEQLGELVADTAIFMQNVRDSVEESDKEFDKGLSMTELLKFLAKIREEQRESSVNNRDNDNKVVDEVVNENPNETITASGATKYKLPDYALQGLYPNQNGVWGNMVYRRDGSLGAVYYFNDGSSAYDTTGTQLSCTYYTLRKLNQRGLSYPCVAGPGSGAYWYGNFDTETCLPRYAGNNALYDLAGSLNLPQENVVVSFASNTSDSAQFRENGHVMLIDRIYRDGNGTVLVDYSDMSPSIGNVNGSNPVKTQTLDAFMSQYNRYNGNINGVVVVGAGN